MRVALLVILFALCAIPTGSAQTGLPQFGGGGGANYGGYAFVECTAANKPGGAAGADAGVVPRGAPRERAAAVAGGDPAGQSRQHRRQGSHGVEGSRRSRADGLVPGGRGMRRRPKPER